MSIWTASASCRSRMRRGLGAGWPACPFALGRGGGRCAGTCGGEQCPHSSAERGRAARLRRTPRGPGRQPAGSAPSFSVLTWKTLIQHSFPGSPQRPLWGGRASSPESGHAGTQLGPGDVCGVAACRGAGRWPRAVNPAAAPQATGGRRVFAGDGWSGKRGRWLRPEPGARGPRPRGCRTPSRRPVRGECGLGRRPWRRPCVIVALRGARSSVPGAAYCVWGVVFRELSGTVSIAVSRYQEALFSN